MTHHRQPKDKIFDVSKPHHPRVGPNATSRPVIVGHRPMMTDPMVREKVKKDVAQDNELSVFSGHKDLAPIAAGQFDPKPPEPEPPHLDKSPAAESQPEPEPGFLAEKPQLLPSKPASDKPSEPDTTSEPEKPQPIKPLPAAAPPPAPTTESHSLASILEENSPPVTAPPHSKDPDKQDHDTDNSHLVGNAPFPTPSGAGPRYWYRRPQVWLLVGLLAGAALYLAIDSGKIKTSIELPFHFFKQASKPAPTAAAPTPTIKTPPPAASAPTGLNSYKLTPAGLEFDFPAAWGTPALLQEPGYSKRGGAAKSDGTYAYRLSFSAKADVEIVVTSGKYLPSAARAALYYDYLQWCTGTIDGKIYKSVMRYSTNGGIDTPTTTICDQGPLTDAVKLDDKTISQLKTKNPDGTVLGDLYTRNLNGTIALVFRVKDANSQNSDDIKKLLASIKEQ